MEYEKNVCPVLDVDGILATGKQFDLEITLPEDNRGVIYGVVKDCYQEPVKDAVVKLIEVVCECGKEERRPVSHTFTDDEGEFVFGPLCANRFYEIQIWVDKVKHCKICTKVEHDADCLKGVKLDCKKDEHKHCHKEEWKDNYKPCCKEECKDDCRPCCKEECKDDYRPCHKEECKDDHRPCHKEECKEECTKDCDKKCENEKECNKKAEKPCRPCFRPF